MHKNIFMNTDKIRGIAFIIIGAISVMCKLNLGEYNSNYVFNDLVFALGSILLVGGLLLLTLGITKLMDVSAKERNNYPSTYNP